MHGYSAGKITLLDIGNNGIGPKGAFSVAEFIKKSKSLLWLNLYMNDIGDEVLMFLTTLCKFYFGCTLLGMLSSFFDYCRF